MVQSENDKMKTIKLTQGKVAIVDDNDFSLVSQHKWYACKCGNSFYAISTARYRDNFGKLKRLSMHRMILGIVDGKIHADHKDCNGLNNTRKNLRICSMSENQHNQRLRISNTSGFKGVSWKEETKKWVAHIRLNYRKKHLGYFTSKELAHKAYCKAAVKLHGKFARFA